MDGYDHDEEQTTATLLCPDDPEEVMDWTPDEEVTEWDPNPPIVNPPVDPVRRGLATSSGRVPAKDR